MAAGLIGPLVLTFFAWSVAHAMSAAPELPAAPAPVLPVREFAPPLIVPEMRTVATPSTTVVSFARLPAVRVFNLNNHDEALIRLYGLDGSLVPESLDSLRRILGDVSKPDAPEYADMDERVIQLMFRAAHRFHASQVVVISGYRSPRKRREGFHRRGLAIDFQLPGVRLAALATYLQSLPHVGVGVYTHAQTQWVHLDSRARSYHWADASGPGAPGGAWSLGDSSLCARQDKLYVPSADWPEGTVPSASAVARRRFTLVGTTPEMDEP